MERTIGHEILSIGCEQGCVLSAARIRNHECLRWALLCSAGEIGWRGMELASVGREDARVLSTGRARARLDSRHVAAGMPGKAHWISTACEYAIGHGWPTPRVVALTCGSIPADNVFRFVGTT